MRRKIENTKEFLKEHDVKASYQRTVIFEYLLDNDEHPSVNTIYQDLVGKIPTLSKTTVYNTLKLFADKGLVEEITIEGHEVRYDIDDPSHGHFKCDSCGRIFDIRLNPEGFQSPDLKDFQVTQRHIHYKGICPECAKNGR
jgi:Fur family transcriptional regulator, peroxide stress response regulator